MCDYFGSFICVNGSEWNEWIEVMTPTIWLHARIWNVMVWGVTCVGCMYGMGGGVG